MSKKEYYGWDQYKEEGVSELKKIKQSKIFSGKDKFQGLLDKYINLYSKKRKYSKQITGKDLYPEKVVDNDTKPAFDKASKTIAEFKRLLKLYYEKGEGQTSEFEIYFVAEERDYRLGVRKKEPSKFDNNKKIPTPSLNNLKSIPQKIGDSVLNFLKIYFDALFSPSNLVLRASESRKFKWDSIFLFLFTSFLTFIILRHYSVPLKFILSDLKYMAVVRANLPDFIINYGISIVAISSNISSLISFDIIFLILRYTFIVILIPWIIANTIFKEKINLSVFSNFQFYFFLSWIPIYIWLGSAFILKSLSLKKVSGIYFTIFGPLSLLLFANYFKGLCKLLNLNWKKGILFYIIAFLLPFLILESL